MSDYLKPITKDDISRIIEEWFPAIERDWGKQLDERLKRVLRVHMLAMAVDIRNRTLEQKKELLEQMISNLGFQKEV